MTDKFKQKPPGHSQGARPNDANEQDVEGKAGPTGPGTSPTQELLTHPAYAELQKILDQTEQKANQAEQKANQYWERILRMQAESENATRRTEREIENAHKYALEKLAKELLPVIDSLELSLSNTAKEAEGHEKALIEGVSLTLKMFLTALEKFGIKEINPISSPFDPAHHQAISMQFEPNVKPGTVVAVLQKGYSLNNRLLRPALVVVAKGEG